MMYIVSVWQEILYVGDHIFGDVIKAKKEQAWRWVWGCGSCMFLHVYWLWFDSCPPLSGLEHF